MRNIAALAQPILKILVSEQKYKNNLKNRESFVTAQVKQEYYFFWPHEVVLMQAS